MDFKKIEKFLLDTGKYLWVLLCGLVLLFNPEGATVLVTKFIGWALVIICALKLIKLAVGDRLHWGREAFYSGACLCVGVILLAKPDVTVNFYTGYTDGELLIPDKTVTGELNAYYYSVPKGAYRYIVSGTGYYKIEKIVYLSYYRVFSFCEFFF